MPNFTDKCQEAFGTGDFYEILKCDRSANKNAIKKAYYKVSLLYHPDRVDDENKETATEKFKLISKIYSILSDDDNRKIYDETGSFSEDDSDSLLSWMNLWRSIFKPISIKDIDDYKKSYIGSDQERRDIRRAYECTKGNMTKMHNFISFMDCDSEERVTQIVREMVDEGELPEYEGFFNETKARKKQRRKKMEANQLSDSEVAALEEEYKQRRAEREKNFVNFMSNLEKRAKQEAIKGRKRKSGEDESLENVSKRKTRSARK